MKIRLLPVVVILALAALTLAEGQTTLTPGLFINGGGVARGVLLAPTSSDCTAPTYAISGDANTGWTSTAADTAVTCTGGTARITTTSASVILAPALLPAAPKLTAGSATGVTVDNIGEVRELVYKATIAETAFVCADVTCDVTIATLPAKTLVTGAVADLTEAFACTATCTSSTLSLILGRGAGGAEFLASFDADAAAAVFGDADAEMGSTMTRAAAIQAGSPEAWASTQAVVIRLTSGTGNIGDGDATNLSSGSVTIYLTTKALP